jgi:hypothetical protein
MNKILSHVGYPHSILRRMKKVCTYVDELYEDRNKMFTSVLKKIAISTRLTDKL